MKNEVKSNFDAFISTLVLCFSTGCINVFHVVEDNDVRWSLGGCSNTIDYHLSESTKTSYFTRVNGFRCCLAPGEHTLICKATSQYTWLSGYILIGGRKYCNDFIGFKAFRRVQISGNV